MKRDSQLSAMGHSAVTPTSSVWPLPALPAGIRWRDLLVVGLALAADLLFVGLYTGDLQTRTGRPVSPILVIAVVGVMASALLWRWRTGLPVLVYVLVISAGLALWLQGAQPIVCVLVALYAAAHEATRRTSLPVLGLGMVAVAITIVVAIGYSGDDDVQFLEVAFPAGVLTSVVLGVWIFGRREQHASSQAAALATEIDQRTAHAARAERERIARELHDILAHSVSAMMMQAAGARALGQTVAEAQPDDRVHSILDALSSIETTGSQSLRELHRLLGTSISPESGRHASGPSDPPGLDDLDELVLTGRKSGLIVDVHRAGTPGELDPSVGIAAYRTVQESLTNALKHLGRGTVVDIYEAWDEQQVQVQVRCRGGHDPVRMQAHQGGLGLQGLRERVELAGGQFEAGWVGEEFVTTAVLPQSGDRSGARAEET